MKVIYFITNMSHGRGGHFYSLKTTVEGLSSVIEPFIINIGKKHSQIVDTTNAPHKNIYCNGWNSLFTLYNLMRVVQKQKPKILHAFDVDALFFARIISFLLKIPLVYTKCGGANPKSFYPYVNEFILYSQENTKFFQAMPKYNKTNFYLIPNRVSTIKSDDTRIELLREKIDSSKKIFLRIARFAPAYTHSMKQSIDLIEILNQEMSIAQLVIIGVIHDPASYVEISEYASDKDSIIILNDDIFTVNASEIIGVADFVIGTGRGLMEAASFKKVLLTPVKHAAFPVLINQDNFMNFFHTNFSPRNRLENFNEEKNVENIQKTIINESVYNELSHYSFGVYEKYFNIESSIKDYKNIYNKIKFKREYHIYDFVLHFIMTMKHYVFK